MKVELENKDLAELFNPDRLHMGARIAARVAVEEAKKLPWKPTDTYIDAVLGAVSKFYTEEIKMDKKVYLFEDWFDPANKEHLAAYRHLRENAMWPEGFKPAGVKMGPYWEELIKFKMIEELLDSRLGKSKNS